MLEATTSSNCFNQLFRPTIQPNPIQSKPTWIIDAWRVKDLKSVPLPTEELLAWPWALTSGAQRANSGRCIDLQSAAASLRVCIERWRAVVLQVRVSSIPDSRRAQTLEPGRPPTRAPPSPQPPRPTVALVRAEEQRVPAQPQVAVAEAPPVERVDLGVCVEVPHALDVDHHQLALC